MTLTGRANEPLRPIYMYHLRAHVCQSYHQSLSFLPMVTDHLTDRLGSEPIVCQCKFDGDCDGGGDGGGMYKRAFRMQKSLFRRFK